ncbi:MAG: hypothetical protein KIT87_19490 [Anaerolineae bacterium]|nr:hypothetical protein [Anaerolineae bacterium]
MEQQKTLVLDDQGRIVVPQVIKERLGLTPGMTLVVEAGDSGDVRLRREEEPRLVKEGNIWVVDGEPLEDLIEFTSRERERRHAELLKRVGL